jgi:hypothetical protein
LIDFEAYADFQNLNGVNLGGVTLTAPNASVVVFANGRGGVSYKSPVNAIGNFQAGGFQQDNPLRGVFDSNVSFVSLWAGDRGGDLDQWELKVFDAADNLLGTATSSITVGDPYEQLTLAFSNIRSFEARHLGPSPIGIGYDDLEFRSVPEPGTLALLGLGLAGLAGLRRRQQ